MLRIKIDSDTGLSSVSTRGISPELLFGILVVKQIFDNHEYHFIVTSIADGQHKRGSRHYTGDGIDFRSKHLPNDLKVVIFDEMAEVLSGMSDYGIYFEDIGEANEHFHLQFKPLYP
jgi:hypothetical protein